MDKTQFHNGFRLKNKIEKSHLKLKIISEKSGIPLSSIYDMYKKPELLRSKIKPILDVIEVDIDQFYQTKQDAPKQLEESGLKVENEALKREIALLKQNLEVKEEIIQLLKHKNQS